MITPPDSPQPARKRTRRPDAIALGVVLVFCLVSFALYLKAYPQLSYVDEFPHFDYVAQLAEGDLVRFNERVGEQAMEAEACRGITGGFQPPACDAEHSPEKFQYGGYNTAALHPPLYYGVTAVLAMGAKHLWFLDEQSLLSGARIGSILWYLAGLGVLYLVLRMAGISPWLTAVALLLMTATPVVYGAVAHVNNDAPSLLVGAIAALLATHGFGRYPMIAGPAFGAFSMLLKATNLMALVVVAVVLVFKARAERKFSPLIHAAGMLSGGAIAHVVWQRVQAARALPAPDPPIVQNPAFHPDSIGFGDVLIQAFSVLTPVMNPPLGPPFGGGVVALAMSQTLHILLLFSLGAALFAALRPDQFPVQLSIGLLVAATVVPIIITLQLWLGEGTYFRLSPRYGLSLLPLLIVPVALLMAQRRSTAIGVTAVMVMTTGMTLALFGRAAL